MTKIVGLPGFTDFLFGTAEEDFLIGDREIMPFSDVLAGIVLPIKGNDFIYGGAGDDQIRGDFDILVGEAVNPGPDPFFLPISVFQDILFQGDDWLFGGSGDDTIYGEARFPSFFVGQNVITDNSLNGGGIFTLFAGGNDHIFGGSGDDIIAGQALLGTVEFSGRLAPITFQDGVGHAGDDPGPPGIGAITADLGLVYASDFLSGGSGDDFMVGDFIHRMISIFDDAELTNSAEYFAHDTLLGGSGEDEMYGDLQTQVLHAGDTSLLVLLSVYGDDALYGGLNDDIIVGDVGSLTYEEDAGATLYAEAIFGLDNIDGGFGDDLLYGDYITLDLPGHSPLDIGGGHDVISGGFGDDTIHGQYGDDTLKGGGGRDTFVYSGLDDNGDDRILDFNTHKDDLLATDGAVLSDGGHDGDGNVIIDVADTGVMSSITLVDVTDFLDVTISHVI